jgi:hypothetical protein
MRTLVAALILALAEPALGERPDPEVKRSVATSMIVVGILTATLSMALVLQNPSADDYPDRYAAGWSAVAISGAAVICGVVALTAPEKPRRRFAFGPTGFSARF